MSDGSLDTSSEQMPADEALEAIQETLISWYEAEHRSFPWRETTDPYEILVSEVMSQQTQLERVEPAWDDFMDRFPTIETLAEADRDAVIGFWTDHQLGYNNRARYLHEAAQQVVADFDGTVPSSPEDLEQLMGVGPYTANAVASFAYNNGDAVVDTNVRRVLYRAFDVSDTDEAFETAARRLLPAGRSRVWNNALMELGGVVCRTQPQCDEAPCPWRDSCEAYASGDFSAPSVQEQPEFEGSRRQFRGRVIGALREHGPLALDDLGPIVRVEYTPQGSPGQAWLRDLLGDLADDGLVVLDTDGEETIARLGQ